MNAKEDVYRTNDTLENCARTFNFASNHLTKYITTIDKNNPVIKRYRYIITILSVSNSVLNGALYTVQLESQNKHSTTDIKASKR